MTVGSEDVTGETLSTTTSALPPKDRQWQLPRNIPEWLSAGANIGLLFLGIATLWITIQIAVIEDYFRSEIAYRNRQLVEARAELDDLKFQAASLKQDLVAGRVENSKLEKYRDQVLAIERERKAALEASLREQPLWAIKYIRLFMEFEQNDHDDRKAILPIAEDTLKKLVDELKKQPMDSRYATEVRAHLASRCRSDIGGPLVLGPVQHPKPSSDEWRAIVAQPSSGFKNEVDEWIIKRDKSTEDWNSRWRLYESEAPLRRAAIAAEHTRVWNAIEKCAERIVAELN